MVYEKKILIFFPFFYRFKRFDNKFIRPYLLRNHTGQEPKILETYSKLAMRDAMDYMRRNASTIGNISGTESMSAIFRNYTSGNFNGRYVMSLNSVLIILFSIFIFDIPYRKTHKIYLSI